MYDVMSGVRVIELSEYIFVPSAAMILADWGADVIKVERTEGGGDATRSVPIMQVAGTSINPHFEVANRGKRSIAIDLSAPEGREHLYGLIDGADVFMTSLRRSARVKLGMEAEDLLERNPRLIYARGTGFGNHGPMADKGAFDFPSSWCRSGAAYVQTPPDGEPPMQPGSVGDLMSGATLAGAVAAALFRRERTGRGGIVDNSLFHVGAYIMTQSISAASLKAMQPPSPRAEAKFPLVNLYKTKDERWISLCLLQERWWPDLARHLGREDLLADPRFASPEDRSRNNVALIQELDRTFATRTFADWKEELDTLEGVWAPLQSPAEVLEDEQLWANGYLQSIIAPDGTSYSAVASPGQFDQRPIGPLRPSPAFARDTDAVLHELGLSKESIAAGRAQGIFK